jgi:hypothetical protein
MDFDELYELTLKTAESKANKQEIALFFKVGMRQVTLDEFL